MKFNIYALEQCFRTAIDGGFQYVAVSIQMEGFDFDEIIINPIENAEKKLEYYMQAYNEDLTHKYSEGIRISGFTYGENFREIEDDIE